MVLETGEIRPKKQLANRSVSTELAYRLLLERPASKDGSLFFRADCRPKKKKKHRGRKLLLVVATAGIALAVSEGLRNKVLDLLFGAEEEFDYTSTTAPATPPPTPAATAS